MEIKGIAMQGDATGKRISGEEYKTHAKTLLAALPFQYQKHFKLDERPFAQSWQINFRFVRRLERNFMYQVNDEWQQAINDNKSDTHQRKESRDGGSAIKRPTARI